MRLLSPYITRTAAILFAAFLIAAWSPATSAAITYIQSASSTHDLASSATATYTGAQSAGDLNVLIVGWIGSGSPSSVTDSKGNTYALAAGPTVNSTGSASESIYYASNIVAASAGSNSVTVNFGASVYYLDVRIAEYSGIATSSPLDGTSGAIGSTTTLNSGSVTTSNANDLLVGGDYLGATTLGAGSGFTLRVTSTYASVLEDEATTSTGSYAATVTVDGANWWIMQVAAFKGSSGGGSVAPSAPTGISATAASATQINLSWTASTAGTGGAVNGYLVERCAGASCTTFAQIGTPTATGYNDTTAAPSTSYRYRVRASDAAGDLSAYSSIGSANTPADTTAPSTPSSLTASAVSSSQINLTWNASTDNVGVSGYILQRCAGASCSSFAQISTPTTNSYSDSGLTASTSYSYRIEATDAAGNLSGWSTTASATTGAASDTQAPTAPTGLAASATSSSQINLTWGISSDNVGVTGYLIERCQIAECTTFTQIGTSSTTNFSSIGLVATTSYSYRVRATDAAGNLSAYSTTASAVTQVLVTTVTYTYDNLKRVTQATGSNGGSVTYTYDANGNIGSIARSAGP